MLLKMAAFVGAMTLLYGQSPTAERAYQILTVGTVDEGFGSQVVSAKPFSATEEKHSLQVLSDGTRIETKQTTRLFRDSQGRTRMEDLIGPGQPRSPGFEYGPITITDPVAGTRTAINPANVTLLTVPAAAAFQNRRVRIEGQSFLIGPDAATLRTENLGTKNVNGVMAKGERVTTIIPAGEIGNNREIRVVTERWYSDELQMLIKSTNTDPRFGDTEYQLTGITTTEPSPSLFQIPAGYTEAPGGRGGARGGRSGAPAPAAPGGRGRGGPKQE
jgi:hypothetical protein